MSRRADPQDNVSTRLRLRRAAVGLATRMMPAGQAGRIAVVAVLSIAALVGARGFEAAVHGLPAFDGAVAVEWEHLPDWLTAADNRRILAGLEEQCGLDAADRICEPTLPRRVFDRLSRPEVGWIAAVERVTARPDRVLSLRCRFRRPIAWVRCGESCYLASDDGVRLPGRYRPESAKDSALPTIAGVRGAPPPVGGTWPGADARAGLRVAAACAAHDFAHQVRAVLVSNYGGRVDRRRPQIELLTDRPPGRIWWGRAPGEEQGLEISAAQKLALLNSLYRRCGRIDDHRPYVNVMNSPHSVAVPASAENASG